GEGAVARARAVAFSFGHPCSPRCTGRRRPVARARRAAEAEADLGGGEAVAPPGEPPPAADPRVRGPALDRRPDPSGARHPGRESAEPSRAAARQLSARIPARLGKQELLRATPARSALARKCARPPRSPRRE